MPRAALTAVASILRKPLFGMILIRRNSTVDPTLFPEDDYPVFCTKCGYCLRGLSDGKCPECGTTFARGQLLVRTYVNAWSGALWRDSAARRWYWRFMVTGIALPIVAGFLSVMYMKYLGNFHSPAFRLPYALGAVMFAAPPLFCFAALVIAVKAYPRGSWKRRRAIIDAIKQASKCRKEVG